MMQKQGSGGFTFCLGALAWCCVAIACAGSAFADTIVTKSGQTLEGVIKDENQFNVRLDTRGNLISVPKSRIKSMTKKTPEENVKTLLERALESIKRMDANSARAYVEQAQTLNVNSQDLRQQIETVNKNIQEMEIRGGTPEEQHNRALTLLARAKEAYDMIKNEEGNRLLLQALKTEPGFQDAHDMINKRLIKGTGIARGRSGSAASKTTAGADVRKNEPQMSSESGDILLAAKYFTQVLWPNSEVLNGKLDSPLIKLLPRIYGTLASLFDETSDPDNAVEYAQLLLKLSEVFAAHPAWKETGDAKLKAVIEKPVNSLLADMVKRNVDAGSYELALRKMKGWTEADASLENCQLALRALVGAEQYPEAIALLGRAMGKFPEQTSLRPRYNALKLLVDSQPLEKTDKARAIASYESIYATRENLTPEIGDTVGRLLARLKGPDMESAQSSGQIWRAADIAAIVMQYGQDQAARRKAAELIIKYKSSRELPWRLDLVWSINGTSVPLTDEIVKMAQERLKDTLAVTFDPASPFVVRLTVDALTDADTASVVESLRNGQALAKPAAVNDFHFTLECLHTTLGSIYKSTWKKADVAQAAASTPLMEGLLSIAMPKAASAAAPTPAPGMAKTAGAKPAPGATPAATAKPTATPTPTPTPAPTPAPAPASAPAMAPSTLPGFPLPPGVNPPPPKPIVPGAAPKTAPAQPSSTAPVVAAAPVAVANPNALMTIRSMDEIKSFVDKKLLGYVKAWPKVTELGSHLAVPKAQQLLTKE